MDLESFLQGEVKPALGCTEPGAVALAVSTAAARLGGPPDSVHLRMSANIYKNGVGVGIPYTLGLRGNMMAAALGAVAGDPEKGLMCLTEITEDDVHRAGAMIEAGAVSWEIVDDVPSVYVEAELKRGTDKASAVVSDLHDTVVEIRVNGNTVLREDPSLGSLRGGSYVNDLLAMDFGGLWRLAGDFGPQVESELLEGPAMNMALAEAGLSADWGMRIGRTLLSGAPGGDLLWRAKAYSAAAADARMDGANLPAMSSAGSGNHGIVALIPPALAAADMGKSARELAEAVALSHLVTGYIKARTGRLTPICGCSVAAGAGAASALVRLSGGGPVKAEAAAANVLASLLGMICDGAKAGCALKVATAAGEAVTSAFLALHGAGIAERDGVLGLDISTNSRAVGEISKIGFGGVDHVLLGLMARNS